MGSISLIYPAVLVLEKRSEERRVGKGRRSST